MGRDMTHFRKDMNIAEESALTEDCPLDVAVESEGGFPCGEFLWDDEEDAEPDKTL